MSARLRPVAVVLLAASGAAACVPPVAHGPRVEPGGTWFLNGGFVHSPGFQGENMAVIPTVYGGGSYGWVTSEDIGFSLGVQAPLLALPLVLLDEEPLDRTLSLFLVDAYVQPRRRSEPHGFEAGVGTVASAGLFMPYVQAGSSGDRGIYTTQGVAFTFGTFDRITYWAPSVSLRASRLGGTRIVDFYAGALFGNREQPGLERHEIEWLVTIGAVAQRRRRN